MVAVNRKKPKMQAKKETKEESKPKVVSGSIKKQMAKKSKKPQKPQRGVMLIKCLPHGFFEEQLKEYFSQFGKVTRVRLARSRRTTKSRGFAFVEFQYPEVAEIAAETMNNYMMFRKMIKTVYIPPEQQKFNYFRSSVLFQTKENGEKKLTSKYLVARERKVVAHNRPLTEDDKKKRQLKAQEKLLALKKKFQKHEIDYDVDAVTPESLKGPVIRNKAMKDEENTEEETDSESEMDLESIEPEKFGFVDESAEESDAEEEAHELDSDVSEEPDPKIAKKKLNESVKEAKEARKKMLVHLKQDENPKKGKKSKKIEVEEESEEEVVEKKGRKKLVGVSKPKKTQKPQKAPTAKAKKAIAASLKDTSKVKVVQKTDMKKKKTRK
ncbi:MKI67 FHA domain-interacting nucleolar phosphoprotein [Culicoides brevitarsis]|uniref:MKI67 FHA domain-interacting nucleolar phosphoprotein n=1 Tax=Culicoides brevitarsis TaxID=469753 RepID=UPI00307BF936